MRVLLTGSNGYKGSVLLPKLYRHEVTTLDIGWFGGRADIQEDIRTVKIKGAYDAFIHLAGIANDPCGELDSKLTWEVNVLATKFLVEQAIRSGAKQFIYASSASVYGLHEGKDLVETDDLSPVSDYNKTKMCAEQILLSYKDEINVQILRPATVCGYSPRMRLDTMVNMLTYQALNEGKITAHCGESGELQRPNIHIEDVTDLYLFMLNHPELSGIYNAAFENLSTTETAKIIQKEIPSEIEITKVKDKRSYRISSEKILQAGFRPTYKVIHAIKDLKIAYSRGFRKTDKSTNLSWMKMNGWAS